jgi:hypothetical protein
MHQTPVGPPPHEMSVHRDIGVDLARQRVGAWIGHAHGLAGHVDPTMLPARFAAAHIGRYACDTAYTRHVMDTRGWTELLRSSGMEPYFELPRYERQLFTSDVFAIEVDGRYAGGEIEVVHRRPATS